MIVYSRVNSEHAGFRELVHQLDSFLAIINGTENAFFNQFNHIEELKYVVVAFEEDVPVGCGAIKAFADDMMEVKRMFVHPAKRTRGIASGVLNELEQWAAELGYRKCILETATALTAAIRLYERSQYQVIPNYGQYAGVMSSVCFEKILAR